jgi:hypothetical protein
MVKNCKTPKKNITVSINNTIKPISINKKIPIRYNSLYNKLKFNVNRCKPLNKNIKLKISNLEEDFNDSFFPYKCYIDLFCKDNHIKYEIFLSNIICNYTIRPILFEQKNTLIKQNLIKDDFSNIKGFNDKKLLINDIIDMYSIYFIDEIINL